MRSRRRRKPEIDRRKMVLIAFVSLFAVAMVTAMIWKANVRHAEEQSYESKIISETDKQIIEDVIPGNPKQEKEKVGQVTLLNIKNSGNDEIKETEETEKAILKETEPETEPQYLENLNEYHPGDIIDSSRIDFDDLSKYTTIYEISTTGRVFSRINGKSYRENDNISLSSLRYIQLLHYNFDGDVQLGELIVNKAIADDVVDIFEELFRNKYEIQSMRLIDDFWTGDPDTSDSASIDKNNTSAFCYRSATGGSNLSKHAYGRAIDINPQQNPYVSYKSGEPKWSHENADQYIDRDTGFEHVITHEDLAFRLFTQHGFTWGGDWSSIKDYQHFEKAQ